MGDKKLLLMLNDQETKALELIFNGTLPIEVEMRRRIQCLKIIVREATGVGFYTTMRLTPPLDTLPDVLVKDITFNHPSFRYGGKFMCWFISNREIELEAVTLGGSILWPSAIDFDLLEVQI